MTMARRLDAVFASFAFGFRINLPICPAEGQNELVYKVYNLFSAERKQSDAG
jgi:hypothetical protein